jgi:hypothetical protein
MSARSFSIAARFGRQDVRTDFLWIQKVPQLLSAKMNVVWPGQIAAPS